MYSIVNLQILILRNLSLARGVKAEQLKSSYAKFKDFEVLNVSDIAVDQFPEAFKDVHAVVHAAAVLPSRNFDHDIKEMIRVGDVCALQPVIFS